MTASAHYWQGMREAHDDKSSDDVGSGHELLRLEDAAGELSLERGFEQL